MYNIYQVYIYLVYIRVPRYVLRTEYLINALTGILRVYDILIIYTMTYQYLH